MSIVCFLGLYSQDAWYGRDTWKLGRHKEDQFKPKNRIYIYNATMFLRASTFHPQGKIIENSSMAPQ